MMKTLCIARKTLVELWREPLLLGLLLIFPLFLLAFYYIALGQTDQGLAYFLKVHVLNQDAGTAGTQLIAGLRASQFEDQPVFDVIEVTDRATAEHAVRERKAAMLIVIPPDFSRTLEEAAVARSGSTATVTLIGDVASDNFVFVRSFLDDWLRTFANRTVGRADLQPVGYAFVSGTGTMTDVQFGVPGMIVFGVMFVTVAAAQIMVREKVAGTLRRLRLTRAGAGDLLPGVILALAGLALLQIPITLIAAGWMGFQSRGSLVLAGGVALLLSVAAVGLGLIVACFVSSDSEAANLSATVAVLMTLLSGALYPMPAAPLFTLGGHTFQIYDGLPTAHAGEALRRILIYGDGLGEIGGSVVALAVLAALFMAAGVGLYQRLQMRQS